MVNDDVDQTIYEVVRKTLVQPKIREAKFSTRLSVF